MLNEEPFVAAPESMNKTRVIVFALAAGVLAGAAAVVLVMRRGSSTPSPASAPLVPTDMRERNRKEIGELLAVSRERGEEARRKEARTQRILQLDSKRGRGEASAADIAELERLRREVAEAEPATRPMTTTRTSNPP